MKMRDIISIVEGSSTIQDFNSLDAIKAWSRSIGVKLEANEHASNGGRYGGDISIVWIERSKKAPPGSGKLVMDALVRYADSAKATISLQADDEVVLPDYYKQFGFKIIKSDSGDDVTPTGPEMLRVPRTRKARRPLGSARPFSVVTSKPIGVALKYSYGNDAPSYFSVFDPSQIEEAEEDARAQIYDTDDRWVGYIVDTIEWTELLPLVDANETMPIPSIVPSTTDEKRMRSNKRWQDLYKLGKKVFDVRL